MTIRCARVFHHGRSTTAILTILALSIIDVAAGAAAEQPGEAKQKGTVVHCGAGQSINRALRRAEAGETILVRGTCHERVVITQPVTLDGGGSAVIDGAGLKLPHLSGMDPELDGLIVIAGVTNVNLVRLTVQNSASNGIVAVHGASVVTQGVTVRSNATVGLAVGDNSTVQVIDTELTGNGAGFDVFTSSSLIVRGTFLANENTIHGGVVNGQSIVELRGQQMTFRDNAAFGIIVGSRSQLAVFGFQSAQASTLTASGNGFAGFGIADSALTIFNDTVVTAANNATGLFVVSGQVSVPSANATVVVHDNGVGLNLSGRSAALLIAGLNVYGNSTGVLADDSSLTLEATPGLPASIAGNSTDVKLSFGSRSTIQNITIGLPLACDGTVLSRGTTTCP